MPNSLSQSIRNALKSASRQRELARKLDNELTMHPQSLTDPLQIQQNYAESLELSKQLRTMVSAVVAKVLSNEERSELIARMNALENHTQQMQAMQNKSLQKLALECRQESKDILADTKTIYSQLKDERIAQHPKVQAAIHRIKETHNFKIQLYAEFKNALIAHANNPSNHDLKIALSDSITKLSKINRVSVLDQVNAMQIMANMARREAKDIRQQSKVSGDMSGFKTDSELEAHSNTMQQTRVESSFLANELMQMQQALQREPFNKRYQKDVQNLIQQLNENAAQLKQQAEQFQEYKQSNRIVESEYGVLPVRADGTIVSGTEEHYRSLPSTDEIKALGEYGTIVIPEESPYQSLPSPEQLRAMAEKDNTAESEYGVLPVQIDGTIVSGTQEQYQALPSSEQIKALGEYAAVIPESSSYQRLPSPDELKAMAEQVVATSRQPSEYQSLPSSDELKALAKQQSQPQGIMQVDAKEWQFAEEFFKKNKDEVRCRFVNDDKTKGHAFIKVEGAIYAVASKNVETLGEGAYGKVKVCQNKQGENFAVKIEGKESKKQEVQVKASTKADKLASRLERKMEKLQRSESDITKRVGVLIGTAIRDLPNKKLFMRKQAAQKKYSILTKIPGKNLNVVLKENKDLNETQKLLIALQCTKEIQRMHGMRILHRDIKPENFMMSVEGYHIKGTAIDFGMATKLSLFRDSVRSIFSMGSGAYKAPEIDRKNREAYLEGGTIIKNVYSKASDTFALGVALSDKMFGMGLKDPEIFREMKSMDPSSRPELDAVTTQLIQQLSKQADYVMAIPGVAQVIYEQNEKQFNSAQEVEALLKTIHHLQAMNKSILSSLTKDAPEYAQFEKLTKELEKINLSKLSDKDIKSVTKQIEKMNKLDVTKISPAVMLKNSEHMLEVAAASKALGKLSSRKVTKALATAAGISCMHVKADMPHTPSLPTNPLVHQFHHHQDLSQQRRVSNPAVVAEAQIEVKADASTTFSKKR